MAGEHFSQRSHETPDEEYSPKTPFEGAVHERMLWEPIHTPEGTEVGIKDPDGNVHHFKDGERFILFRDKEGNHNPRIIDKEGTGVTFEKWVSTKETITGEFEAGNTGLQAEERSRLNQIFQACMGEGFLLIGKEVVLDDADLTLLTRIHDIAKEITLRAEQAFPDWNDYKAKVSESISLCGFEPKLHDGGTNAPVVLKSGDTPQDAMFHLTLPTHLYSLATWENTVEHFRRSLVFARQKGLRAKTLGEPLGQIAFLLKNNGV